jgi:TetR/AcrR family acrAB operon transcriptional repressor
MVRRTKAEAEVTRAHILDAAEIVFLEYGVARSSLADIAARAGVTRGAIYWHFNNKVDVLNAMLERVVLPMQAISDAIMAASSDHPLADIHRSTVQILRRVSTDRRTQRVFDIVINKCELVDEIEEARETYLLCRDRCTESMARGFRSARTMGLLKTGVTPKTAAIGLHALIEGLISSWMLAPGKFKLPSVADAAVGNYLAGLRANSRRR